MLALERQVQRGEEETTTKGDKKKERLHGQQ